VAGGAGSSDAPCKPTLALLLLAFLLLTQPSSSPQSTNHINQKVHVWAPPELADKFPYAGELLGSSAAKGAPPPLPGSFDELIAAMDAAGVAGALAVQVGG
jgi:hypothetical protein